MVAVDLLQRLRDGRRRYRYPAVDLIVKAEIAAETFDVAVENGANDVALRIDRG